MISEAWHSRSADEALAHFGSSAAGLSAADASARLAANGPNQLTEGTRIGPLTILLRGLHRANGWIHGEEGPMTSPDRHARLYTARRPQRQRKARASLSSMDETLAKLLKRRPVYAASRISQGRKSLRPSMRVPRARRGSRGRGVPGSSCARGPSWLPR